MTTPSAQVRVDLGDRGYDVLIGSGALAKLPDLISRSVKPRRVALIADRGLPAAAIASVQTLLQDSGLNPLPLLLTATELEKSLTTATGLLVEFTRNRLERSDAVVALGGGIVGDIAGFAAAIYRRGIPVFQCPTTLLAMVDASVGGKTGVNLQVGSAPGDLKKNMVGAFHQPSAVIADTAMLATLPDRHFRCGLAECIKHGMLAADWGDPGLLQWTLDALSAIASRHPDRLAELVTRNVRVKATVVGRDEREENESGGRMSLNLGHTFAHAFETLPGVALEPSSPGLLHGEAVALGLTAASRCAQAIGLIEPAYADRVIAAIRSAGLPTSATGIPPDQQVLALMAHDKKSSQGRLRLVLPMGPGRVCIKDDVPAAAISQGLQAIRA